MHAVAKGAMAGLVATVPMTVAMKAMHRALPPHEQYPLPPRLITEEVAEDTGIAPHLNEKEQEQMTWAAHFSYGAAMGALYGPVASHLARPGVTSGVLFGLTVWAGSYLGLLPAAGILRPATEHPPRRTALMIAAHVVWGGALGALVSSGRKRKRL